MEELLPDEDTTTCRLVALHDDEARDRELERLAPQWVDKTRALLDLNRPELQHGPHGTVVVLFTVDRELRPLRWVVVGTERGVLVVGDPAHADELRETLERLHPREPDAVLRVVLLGLARSVPAVLDGDPVLGEDPEEGFRLSRGNQRSQLRQRRSRLFTVRELFSTQSRELGELDEAHGQSHDVGHAVRRARSAFDQGGSTAARLYALAGDELTEESAIVNERLTLVSTVFLPLTVTTGFFGMNFSWMTDRVGSMAAFVVLGIVVPAVVALATYAIVRQLGAGKA